MKTESSECEVERMRVVDIETWERRDHFRLFQSYSHPYFSICADVEVTRLVAECETTGESFFARFLYSVMKTINSIPEFRYRIRGDSVVLHDVVHPSYTVMTAEHLFRFVTTRYDADLNTFLLRVRQDIDVSKSKVDLSDAPGVDDLIYVSSLRWVSFTSVTHPYDAAHPDSFPRITWGKHRLSEGRRWIPVSVMAHHGLCDGEHAARFYELLQAEIR